MAAGIPEDYRYTSKCLAINLRKQYVKIFIKTDSFRKASGFFSEKLVDGFHPYRDPSRLVSVSG